MICLLQSLQLIITKDFVWKWGNKDEGDKYLRCFCDENCTGSIIRLKDHLAHTHNNIKPRSTVSPVKKECEEYFKKIQDDQGEAK